MSISVVLIHYSRKLPRESFSIDECSFSLKGYFYNLRGILPSSLLIHCLYFHLLDLDCVSLVPPHIHIMVALTEIHDGLVYTHIGSNKDEVARFLVHRLDDKPLMFVVDVADF